MPYLSIIMPVHNGEQFLSKSIESVLAQTFTDFELVIINDGSSDQTEIIAREYQQNNSRIKLINIKNSGVSHARNLGIQSSESELITFLDADDLYEKNILQCYLDHLLENDLVCIGNYQFRIKKGEVQTNGKMSSLTLQANNQNEIFQSMTELIKSGCFNQVWNKIYKKQIILDNKIEFPENMSLGEDFLFNLSYINCISRFVCVDRLLYGYNVTETSLSRQMRVDRFSTNIVLSKELEKAFQTRGGGAETAFYFALKGLFGGFVDCIKFGLKNTKKIILKEINEEYIQQIAHSEIIFSSKLFRCLKKLIQKNAVTKIFIMSKIYKIYKYH